ncbi:hypothetical protein ACWGB8_11130 [Kitasatospora sp. NPDC054939]
MTDPHPLLRSHAPVPELEQLRALQDSVPGAFLADGFELTAPGDTSVPAAGRSADRAFLDRLTPFAQANFSGSLYALWWMDDRPDPGTLPVVVFGDEGGEFVVARSLSEFFRLLACDVEIAVDREGVHIHRRADYEPSSGHRALVDWLHTRFGLAPSTDPAALVAAAHAALGGPFTAWTRRFLPH